MTEHRFESGTGYSAKHLQNAGFRDSVEAGYHRHPQKQHRKARVKTVALGAVFVGLLLLLGHTEARYSDADAAWFGPVVSSHYGPSLWGNRTACGQRLTRRTWGVAHRTAPCGRRVTLRYRGRVVRVRVIDRGPFVWGRTFDLTQRTARRLCGCDWWGIRAHTYHWGWK